MERRAFLSLLAGSPLIFGLRELGAQEPAPGFVEVALRRMKSTRRFGVFLILPKGEERRKRMGQALLDRLAVGSDSEKKGFDLFSVHVFVCLTEEQATAAGLGAKVEGEGLLRILVNPEGKRVDANRVDPGVLENPEKFADSFSTFIHGEGGARLREHAKAIEKDFTPELKKAAERLKGDPGESAEAFTTLMKEADSIAPWLLQKKIENENPKFDLILWGFFMHRGRGEDPEPVMPFGLKAEPVAVEDPCPPCGMAAYRPTAYRFISFYAK